ncbi:type II toxin-antitoxin system PemK/MazF family toxin [Paenibacillus elgii]|uniref:type II toxin-antitoxin system PemK/MazF family toxin n=1 Tax=Paenibacillus elgii TaxID=189691 RepID=UPI00203D49CE|nr:type II toxin-antitoxin system PemK/MazF family toxin [Paenibacillus elgii]MCM3273890.1 type II toxin-antitoxin system PemK/MazF family toxin [Paenibacillus elgii]
MAISIDTSRIDLEINVLRQRLSPANVKEYEEAIVWANKMITLNHISRKNALIKLKRKDKRHPIVPKRREIWTAELGVNVGVESSDFHSVLIIQNDKGNEYSETTIVLPLSSLDAGEKIDNFIHHKIDTFNLEEIYKENANDKPSKVKITDITTIDKSRLIERVSKVKIPLMLKIQDKMKKILDFT